MNTNANTALYDKRVDRAAMLRLYEAGLQDKLDKLIDDHAVRTSNVIKGRVVLKDSQAEMEKEILRAYAEAHNLSSRELIKLTSDQLDYTSTSLSSAIGKIWMVQRPQNFISDDIVLKRPLYGDTTLSNGWAHIATQERHKLEQLIRRGIAEGKNEQEIADAVYLGSAFKVSKQQSFGLARTAITSVTSQADHAVYEANEKALVGYQYVAVLDTRTTPLCAARDGLIFKIGDVAHLPPAHWHCRSTTTPVVKAYADFGTLDSVAAVRKRNLSTLSPEDIAYYDGQTPLRETYSTWLGRQPTEVVLKHLGDYKRVELFRTGQLTVDQFVNFEGKKLSLKQLRVMSDAGQVRPGDTTRFAIAKERLDAIRLGATKPEDFYGDKELTGALREYYKLQAGELDGTLSLTNYRGTLLGNKKATRQRVMASPPTEDNLKFNPITGRYEDARVYQPNPGVLDNTMRLTRESSVLKDEDKKFLESFIGSLDQHMSVNERAVVAENLRITFTRYRNKPEAWGNLKAVLNSEMKFDVMNVSDYIETQLRKDANLLARLKQDDYLDPVLGAVQLRDLHDSLIGNIHAKNAWEDNVAPKIAKQLRNVLDNKLPLKLWNRLDNNQLNEFYLKFAHRLSLADTPDRDQLAVALGRDLYNLANYRGSRTEWYNLGVKLIDDAGDKGFYSLETFGVQKRRMKSRNGGRYFGPYYDTFSVNLRVTDPRIQKYTQLSRKVDLGLRVAVTTDKNVLKIRPGFKTYFDSKNRDTRIPITSVSSFSDFPIDLVDDEMANALNWAATTKYKVDPDFYDAVQRILYFEDDRGRARYFNELNEYKKYIVSRGDAYERFKAMEWLRKEDLAFSNHPFLDHRARIYERGLIGPQSGETFRPFLSTMEAKAFSATSYDNLQDQIGGFLGGLSDNLEGRFNSLSFPGRQRIAEKWRSEMITIGDQLRRGKPNDIRAILESNFLAEIDGEEQGKALRLALEMSKINEYLGGNFSRESLKRLSGYKTALALEQDASSSGAQIIAITTKNKQLAELSNVVLTTQKRRLYDEIAAATFHDPRFIKLNEHLGLAEKDLRKAAKAQNMVTFYGAGEKTGIMNVENKLAKALGREEGVLVVKAAERDAVLDEISARMARYEKFDPEMYQELKALRQDVKDIFNKGLSPGDEIMDQLYFLDPRTRDFVEKMTRQYTNVVTPNDFQAIAHIMSDHLQEKVPILKDFTRFFGRLAEEFVSSAKPGESRFDFTAALKTSILGAYRKGEALPEWLSKLLGLKVGQPLSEALLERLTWWNPNSSMAEILQGVKPPKDRRLGFKFAGMQIGTPNELAKEWTKIPWVNFDGKTLEQVFTQTFEEKLSYRDKDGKWITNIVQVAQKTDPSWWEEFANKGGKIRDIVDAQKARTAYAVNGNHSNDAVLVKRFHLWGRENNVQTSTIHDAFFTNAGDMVTAKTALRAIYAEATGRNSIKATLDEMYARGLPKEIYDRYLNEAIDIGLIPVVGRSRVGGKLITECDILKVADVTERFEESFERNRGWYGIG